jgi:segregation and condensation protein A
MSFRVELMIFRGPLDLLLYLVRKHELEVVDIPMAEIVDQFLEHLEVLEELDINSVGDFIEVAAQLVEMKSRSVLPRVEEPAEVMEDPRDELVQRLLEYKNFRDVASMLEERSRQWQQHYGRLASDIPSRQPDPATQPIQEVELWDLVSAFGRIIRDSRTVRPSNIVYDDTPIQVYMQRIHARLAREGRASFSDMFSSGMHKSAMIGVFLAILELVRHHSVRTEQNDLHGEIWVLPGESFSDEADWGDVDTYEGRRPVDEDLPGRLR